MERSTVVRGIQALARRARLVAAHAQPGDVVLVMSNGEFGGLWTKLLARLDDAAK